MALFPLCFSPSQQWSEFFLASSLLFGILSISDFSYFSCTLPLLLVRDEERRRL
jgi:hypothetical protein